MSKDVKQIEEFIKTRDNILKKPLTDEAERLSKDTPNKKIDLKPDVKDKGKWWLHIDDKKYEICSEIADLFFDMLAGNRLLTKTNEELKITINKHKIMSKPEGVNIIKPIGVGNATKT